MDKISTIILLFCSLLLASCGEYGGRERIPIPDQRTSTQGVKTGYLIDRVDWILGVDEELLVENRHTPTEGRQITFDGQSVFVETGSKIIAWRCNNGWAYREIFIDHQRFKVPDFAPGCVA